MEKEKENRAREKCSGGEECELSDADIHAGLDILHKERRKSTRENG